MVSDLSLLPGKKTPEKGALSEKGGEENQGMEKEVKKLGGGKVGPLLGRLERRGDLLTRGQGGRGKLMRGTSCLARRETEVFGGKKGA